MKIKNERVLAKWQQLLVFALILVLPVSAVMVAVNNHKVRFDNLAHSVSYQQVVEQRLSNITVESVIGTMELADINDDDIQTMVYFVGNVLESFASEILQMVATIDNGTLRLNNEGELVVNNPLARVSISASGLRFDRNEVYNIVTAMPNRLQAVAYALAALNAAIWVAIGWIPIFGQIIAGAITIYTAVNATLLGYYFIDAMNANRGVEIYVEYGIKWFVPYAYVAHRMV